MRNPRLIGTVLGLALFLAFNVLFHQVPGSREKAGALLERGPYILFALCVPLLLYFVPRYRRSQVLSEEGLRLLAQGRVVSALEQLETARRLARVKAGPTYNIGICRLQLWQLEAAERELSVLAAREDLTPQFRAMVCSALALVAALDGRLKQAVQRFDEAKALQGAALPLAVLSSAVVACRTGRWAEAREQLGQPELRQLDGPLRGLRAALEAWCHERLTGRHHFVEAISVFGEASPDSLQAAWPELVSFLLERSRRTG